MRTSLIWFGIGAALLLTIASGMIQGRISHRWGVSDVMVAAGRTLEEQFPDTIGDWRRLRSNSFDENSLRILQPTGHVVRVYENPKTGARVSMFMFVGPMGPTAEHTPDVCLGTHAYRQIGDQLAVTIPGTATEEPHHVWMATFEQTTVDGGYLRAWWAWSRGEVWEAPENSRASFLGAPYLYKLQVQALQSTVPAAGDTDPCREFLDAFLPISSRVLVPPT